MSCSNGLLHVPTRALYPHSPTFFVHHSVPFAFDPEAPAPARWLRFLDELWGDDEQSERTLQELFGYLVAGDTSRRRFRASSVLDVPARGRSREFLPA